MSVVNDSDISGVGGGATIGDTQRNSTGQPLIWVARNKGWLMNEPYSSINPTTDSVLDWNSSVSGTGAAVGAEGAVSGIADGFNQRYHTLATGTDTSGRASLYTVGGTVNDWIDLPAGMDMECYWRVLFTDLSDATDTYTFKCGLCTSNTNSLGADNIEFEADSDNDANWQCRTRASSTSTDSDSGVVIAADEWIDLLWHYSATDTQVTFYINGTEVASSTTNIPTGTGPNMHFVNKIYKTAGTTSRVAYTTGFQVAMWDAS